MLCKQPTCKPVSTEIWFLVVLAHPGTQNTAYNTDRSQGLITELINKCLQLISLGRLNI